jgi:hypothetical protein
LVRKIEVPNADAGSRDALQKTLVSSRVFGRWMWGGGHVAPAVRLEHTEGDDTNTSNGRLPFLRRFAGQ